jgi:hypothetical protein
MCGADTAVAAAAAAGFLPHSLHGLPLWCKAEGVVLRQSQQGGVTEVEPARQQPRNRVWQHGRTDTQAAESRGRQVCKVPCKHKSVLYTLDWICEPSLPPQLTEWPNAPDMCSPPTDWLTQATAHPTAAC